MGFGQDGFRLEREIYGGRLWIDSETMSERVSKIGLNFLFLKNRGWGFKGFFR